MNSVSNEKDELIALSNGSNKAFETIYKRYAGQLYNFVMTLSRGNRYMAEEVVQSVFMKLWEMREQINPDKKILPLLSTIAKNMLMSKYQRQTLEHLYHEFLLKEHAAHNVAIETEIERAIDQKDIENYIDKLIERLPSSRKLIFELNKKEYLSAGQIAERMKISVSTVETQLSLATKFIRKKVEENYNTLFSLLALLINYKNGGG